jgi:Flp pilus assembly protein TadG
MTALDRAPRPPREHGQVIVIFCLALVALMAAAGLAFDVGRFYSERRFLQNAADAAALAAGNSLVQGKTTTEADAAARAVLTRNFAADPTGSSPQLPPTTPVYTSGHSGDPSYLINGILISGGEIRVAVQSNVGYTFGRAVGLLSNTIITQARVKTNGSMLPIAVRHYVSAPGPNSVTTSPCTATASDFQDFLSTENTACLGSESNASLRTTPSTGADYPTADPTSHGPEISIVGDDAKPSNNASFRGFIALDIRNFESDAPSSTVYYNGVTAGTGSNVLKDLEAGWVNGGYPGPAFPAATTPADPNDQVGLMDGNSTGAVVDAIGERYKPGDEVLVAVYSGTTMTIPDFQLTVPASVSINSTQNRSSNVTMSLSANAAFGNGQVTSSAFTDWGDPTNPLTLGTLAPITFSPNPIGAPATITWTSFQTTGAAQGIYTIWVQGHSSSPYLKDHYYPVALNVAGVNRDFSSNGNGKVFSTTSTGGSDTEAIGFSTSNKGGTSFGGSVHLSLEGGPGSVGVLPAGIGSVSFSQNDFSLGTGASVSVSITINGGTLGPGLYPLTIRATGTNSSGYTVTHLVPITLGVATSSSSTEYVDIEGFAVFRITCTPTTSGCPANSIDAYAISGSYADMNDPALRRGQVARLVPWN